MAMATAMATVPATAPRGAEVPKRALVLLLALAAACAGGGDAGPAPLPETPPERVVVLGPSTAANLEALGLFDRVAAVSDWCAVPAAAGRPRVGGQLDPDLEAIAALGPDLLLTQGRIPVLEDWCRRNGIPLHAFKTQGWEDWEEEVFFLGRLFGRPGRAADLVQEARAELALVSLEAVSPPRRALLVASRDPSAIRGLLVAGGGSFLQPLLEHAGGLNVFGDDPRDWFDLDEETLVRAAPEVILEFHPGGEVDEAALLATWKDAFPELPAVRAGRVRALTGKDLLHPGPNMPHTAAVLAAALRD